MKPIAIEAKGLKKQFDKKVAVHDLSLTVEQGEFFGFLGPNGAGKSTTIKMLVGLLRPSAGTATISGFDVWQEPLKAKAQLGVLPEGLNLYERLNAREFIRFAGTMYGLEKRDVDQRTEELLALMDLEDAAEKLIVDYSQGMRKKTALAAAIIHAPRVLFLDEPFEGIDAISVRAIRQVLDRLRSSGTTIFFSSHILEVVQRLCTRIAVINEGELVAAGTMAELRQKAQSDPDSTLEDLFLKAVGAEEKQNTQIGELSWLDGLPGASA
ncbi:MAG: ABC transporter ATP-binding protein [Ardenticatenaceae bacterium]|nr:ABC transporter ATP-binding protein [Ardenticatenaceae bacterium]